MSKDKINARTLLSMAHADIPLEMQRLSEANRYLLAHAASRLIISLGGRITPAEAEAYGVMFESLGPARLKVHIYSVLTDGWANPDGVDVLRAVHPWIAQAIVTGVCGVEVGAGGLGQTPQLGVCDSDKFDMFVLQESQNHGILGRFYDRLVAIATAQGTVLVDELPPQTV
jgi:hypothetical protein